MSKLTLEEAISHCLEVAEQEECFINYPHSDTVLDDLDIESRKHFVEEQRQLAEWLSELKRRREWCEQYEVEHISDLERYDMLFREGELLCERYEEAKRLLKSAISEWPFVCEWGECGEHCEWYVNGQCSQEWSGKAEALKLMEDERNEP